MRAETSGTRYMLHLLAVLQAVQSLELQAELHPTGLSLSKNRILSWAANCPESTVTELSKAVAIDRTTLTRVLDQLERQGFVNRLRSARDRREVRISVTDDGLRAVAAGASATCQMSERYVGVLPPCDLDVAIDAALALLRVSSLDRPTLRKLTRTDQDQGG